MKSALLAFTFLFSVSAFAETIILSPGEAGYFGSTKIVCSGQAPQPVDQGPVCKLVGTGVYNGFSWAYRVGINNDIVSGTDDLNAAIASIAKYRSNGLCGVSPAGVCKLSGPGVFNGFTWANRILVGDVVVAGTDDQNNALSIIAKLRTAGLCK